MDRFHLDAKERTVLGKKVKGLRKTGLIPGHVFGNGIETEHVSVNLRDFLPVLKQAGETGLIDLQVGDEKVRPVMIRDTQYNPVTGDLLHIDFYQVNLKEKVKVYIPIVLKALEEEIESVKMGEAVVLHVLNEVEVEALPADLIDQIEVDIKPLKNVGDTITVGTLSYDMSKLTVLADPQEIVVKLAPAVTEEMKALLEEQETEAAAVQEAVEGEEAVEASEEVESKEDAGEVAVGEKNEEKGEEKAD